MSEPQYQFAEFQLDCASFELTRQGRSKKGERISLERIPMELLILLLERQGCVVSRQEIIDRLWGKDVFVDTEHGINTAIRKVRHALKDDPDQPRFVTIALPGNRPSALRKLCSVLKMPPIVRRNVVPALMKPPSAVTP